VSERKRVGLREVRALKAGETVWDAAVAGFAARLQVGTARDEARRLLGDVAKGTDPAADKHAARDALTVSELCDRYRAEAEAGRLLIRGGRTKKPTTLAADRGMIRSHNKPLLGRLAVAAVTRADVDKFMHAVATGATKRDSRKIGLRAVSTVRGGRGVATKFPPSCGGLGARISVLPSQPARVARNPEGTRWQQAFPTTPTRCRPATRWQRPWLRADTRSSPRHWRRRPRGGGPPFRHFGARVLYKWSDALAWGEGRLSPPRHSASEADAHRAA